jgi:hypothetical protein
VSTIMWQAVEALLAGDTDCPGDRQSDVPEVLRVQVLRRAHQTSDDAGDGVVREVTSADVGGVQAAARIFRRAYQVLSLVLDLGL